MPGERLSCLLRCEWRQWTVWSAVCVATAGGARGKCENSLLFFAIRFSHLPPLGRRQNHVVEDRRRSTTVNRARTSEATPLPTKKRSEKKIYTFHGHLTTTRSSDCTTGCRVCSWALFSILITWFKQESVARGNDGTTKERVSPLDCTFSSDVSGATESFDPLPPANVSEVIIFRLRRPEERNQKKKRKKTGKRSRVPRRRQRINAPFLGLTMGLWWSSSWTSATLRAAWIDRGMHRSENRTATEGFPSPFCLPDEDLRTLRLVAIYRFWSRRDEWLVYEYTTFELPVRARPLLITPTPKERRRVQRELLPGNLRPFFDAQIFVLPSRCPTWESSPCLREGPKKCARSPRTAPRTRSGLLAPFYCFWSVAASDQSPRRTYIP